jgi:hypothetical protein
MDVYKVGDIMENPSNCGGYYKVEVLPIENYFDCDAEGNKYYQVGTLTSSDGSNWDIISTSRGELYESHSTDCGCQERWVDVANEFICEENNNI